MTVSLGMVFTEIYYRTSIGRSLFRYLTLEDFLDEGVRGVFYLATFWAFCELIFGLVKSLQGQLSHRWRFIPHLWILNRSGSVAALVFAALLLWTALGAFMAGKDGRADFFAMTPESTQLATVMDGTVLRDVHLIGTTSRTATFLQVCEWAKERPDARRRLSGCDQTTRAPREGEVVRSGRVLVMDRALVVCHGEGEVCDDQVPVVSEEEGTGGGGWHRDLGPPITRA